MFAIRLVLNCGTSLTCRLFVYTICKFVFMYTVIIMLYVCTCTARVLHCRLALSIICHSVHVVSKSDISEPSHIMGLRDTTTKYVILLT